MSPFLSFLNAHCVKTHFNRLLIASASSEGESAQTRLNFRCSHSRNIDVDAVSDPKLDLKYQHWRLLEAIVHMRKVPTSLVLVQLF